MINKKVKDTYIIPFLFIITSFILNALTKGTILGFCTLTFAFLSGWFAATQKWYNYLFGGIFTLLNAYVSWEANLYGIAILSCVLYFPLQVQGLFEWYFKRNKDNTVTTKSFDKKTSVLIIISCFAGSIALGLLLSRIPHQQLAFLDSTSNIINICSIILMNLRFKECFWILLGNNVADLAIWIINFIMKLPNSSTMLIVSIVMLILNLIALKKWNK